LLQPLGEDHLLKNQGMIMCASEKRTHTIIQFAPTKFVAARYVFRPSPAYSTLAASGSGYLALISGYQSTKRPARCGPVIQSRTVSQAEPASTIGHRS
ncbi:hypothetical protein JTL43_34170, partial [Pseudomonas aeruginosa]|nr:hypothetical protein [Pseudomonas aeruginosa]